MSVEVEQLSALPEGIDALFEASIREGYGMVKILIEKYRSGENNFTSPGEALFGAFMSSELVGVGGVNIDPYFNDASLGRIRHLYVVPCARHLGVGRAIVLRIEQRAQQYFTTLQLQSPTYAASVFYKALGYSEVIGTHKVSHEKCINS